MVIFKNISKYYQLKKRRIIALDDACLSLPDNGFVLLEGNSGSGKSTFIKLLSLQLKPSKGNLVIDNKDITTFKDKDILEFRKFVFGIVDQDFNLINSYTVKENLSIAIEIQGNKFDLDQAINTLKEVGLDESFLERKVFELSGGEQQRVAIARALIKHSKIIVCDEPTGNLDEDNALQIANLLKDISKTRLVVVASHDKRLMEQYADRIILIKHGKITKDIEVDTNKNESIKNNNNNSLYKFPFKRSFKLALSFLKSSVVKLVFLTLSTFLTVSVAMISSSILSYDENTLRNKSIEASGSNYYYVFRPNIVTSEEEMNDFYDVFKKENVIPISKFRSLNYINEKENDERILFNYSLPMHSRYTSWLNYSLFGRIPNDNSIESDSLEIVLSVHKCAELGWIKDEYNYSNDEIENIINTKSLNMKLYGYTTAKRDVELKIVGVYDTKYPILDEKFAGRLDYEETLSHIENNEIHNSVFFAENDFYELTVSDEPIPSIYSFLIKNSVNFLDDFKPFEANGYYCRHRVDHSLDNMHSFEEFMGVLLEYIAFAFLGITVISFIALLKSIMDKSVNEIRILQLLGLSKSELFVINLIETMFISLLCFLIAFIPYVIIINYLNSYLVSDLLLLVAPLGFVSWQLFVIILLPLLTISFLLSLFSTLVLTKINVKNANNNLR